MELTAHLSQKIILIKKSRIPLTKTQPQLKKNYGKKTKNNIETSVIDLSTNQRDVKAYISGFEEKEKIKKLLKNREHKKSYFFDSLSPYNLKELFINTLDREGVEFKMNEFEKEIFEFTYDRLDKEEIYNIVNRLYLEQITNT